MAGTSRCRPRICTYARVSPVSYVNDHYTTQAAIFASFLSTFLVQTLTLLQEDPLDSIKDILLYQTLIMQNSTLQPYVSPVFTPPVYAIAVNAFFFASLGVVLITAVLCMLVKGWIRGLDRKLWAVRDLQKRAVIKELREDGMRQWKLPGLIAVLPILIHISLALFFVGLVIYLFHIHILPALLSFAIFGAGLLIYVVPILIAAADEFSPFKSVHSRALGQIYRRWYYHLAESLAGVLEDSLDSRSTMALPRTQAELIREKVIVQIQKHVPLSELAITGRPPPWAKAILQEITSRTSVSLLNRLYTYTAGWEVSIHPRNISTCILLHLDDLDIRCPTHWPFLVQYETDSLSVKEVHCLAYGICMQGHNVYSPNWKPVITALEHSSDPWFHLVASLLRVRCAHGPLGILEREADILYAISNTNQLTTDQWCFALSAVYALFPRARKVISPKETRAFTRVLARLLQKRVYYIDRSTVKENGGIDLWLYLMTSILVGGDKDETSKSESSSLETRFSHARDVEKLAKGMTRDPGHIRRLLQLSRQRGLDPSLMRGCLVSIIFVLVRLTPKKRQEINLVEQYLGIVKEEMDIDAWTNSLAEFFTNQHSWPLGLSNMVMCLLSGTYTPNNFTDRDSPRLIMEEYDRNLMKSGAQPTTSFMRVMDEVIKDPLSIVGLRFHSTWLSIYADNRTRSPHSHPIPEVWSPDCISITSNRLDLYDRGQVIPEIDAITFFLSCPSPRIACRALCWYFSLEENSPIYHDDQYLTSFPIIFRRGLSTYENCESWQVLVNVLIPKWAGMSLEAKADFVKNFFGDEYSRGNTQSLMGQSPTSVKVAETEKSFSPLDIRAPQGDTQADGLGWMEDILETGLVRKVNVDRTECYWNGLLRATPEGYRPAVEPEELNSSLDLSLAQDGALDVTSYGGEAALTVISNEGRLEASGLGLLGVLALLVEAEATSIPTALLDRLRNSPLLADKWTCHDTESLSRIRAVVNPNQDD